ncbi:hypothetical protein KC362_g94 [Hortaea werneckii]|nr:hypothetical protein KC362_g94 [Hortaea werneckii]
MKLGLTIHTRHACSTPRIPIFKNSSAPLRRSFPNSERGLSSATGLLLLLRSLSRRLLEYRISSLTSVSTAPAFSSATAGFSGGGASFGDVDRFEDVRASSRRELRGALVTLSRLSRFGLEVDVASRSRSARLRLRASASFLATASASSLAIFAASSAAALRSLVLLFGKTCSFSSSPSPTSTLPLRTRDSHSACLKSCLASLLPAPNDRPCVCESYSCSKMVKGTLPVQQALSLAFPLRQLDFGRLSLELSPAQGILQSPPGPGGWFTFLRNIRNTVITFALFTRLLMVLLSRTVVISQFFCQLLLRSIFFLRRNCRARVSLSCFAEAVPADHSSFRQDHRHPLFAQNPELSPLMKLFQKWARRLAPDLRPIPQVHLSRPWGTQQAQSIPAPAVEGPASLPELSSPSTCEGGSDAAATSSASAAPAETGPSGTSSDAALSLGRSFTSATSALGVPSSETCAFRPTSISGSLRSSHPASACVSG